MKALNGKVIDFTSFNHDFPFINICKVLREVLKTKSEGPLDLAKVDE